MVEEKKTKPKTTPKTKTEPTTPTTPPPQQNPLQQIAQAIQMLSARMANAEISINKNTASHDVLDEWVKLLREKVRNLEERL